MASPEDNEAAIRVQLSLMNAQDSAAATSLANSLKEIAKMFDAIKSSNFQDSVSKMSQLHAQMVRDTQQMQQQARTIPSNIAAMATPLNTPSNASLAAASDPARAAAQRHRDEAASAEKERREVERWRLDSLDDQQRQAEHQRTRLGLPGVKSSADDPSAWYNRVDNLSGETSGFRIPRFGELNIQDLLSRAQEGANRAAAGGDEAAQGRAVRLQQASNTVGNLYAAREFGGRAMAAMARQGFSPGGMDAGGAALGFRRDSNAFSDILGMQTPFSAAGQQGLRQSLDIQKLRFQAGINKEQAAGIVGAAAGAGFSGETGSAVARDFMAPLFRQFQIEPSQLAAHLQVIRTGTATLGDLSKELSDIGETARTAEVSVGTMNQALVQAGEASQAIGGTYMSGMRFGRTFTQSTGLLPGVGQNVLQNSTTQAMLSGATGLPGFALGAASTSAKMASIQSSMRMYYNAYKGALGTSGQRTAIRDAQGNVLGWDEGTNPAMASLGAKYGISGDEAEKLMKGQDRASRLTTLNTALDAYGRDFENAGNNDEVRRARARIDDMGPNFKVDPKTGKVMKRQVYSGAKAGSAMGAWVEDGRLTEQFKREAGATGTRLLRTTGADKIGEDDIRTAAKEAGLNGHAVAKAIREGKTADEQIANVRRLADEKGAQDRAKYEIAFTGPAAKFFKALAKKNGLEDQFNSLPSNVAAASSQGTNPLSNLTNSGLGSQNNNTPMP